MPTPSSYIICHHVLAPSRRCCCCDHRSTHVQTCLLDIEKAKRLALDAPAKLTSMLELFACFILPPSSTIDAFSVSPLPSMPHQNVPGALLRALSKFPTKNKNCVQGHPAPCCLKPGYLRNKLVLGCMSIQRRRVEIGSRTSSFFPKLHRNMGLMVC